MSKTIKYSIIFKHHPSRIKLCTMRVLLLIFVFSTCLIITGKTQGLVNKANAFIGLLDNAQKGKALFPFDTTERYRFHFVPQDDRKGISLNELNPAQLEAGMELLKACLSEATSKQVNEIRQLDLILKELEHRKPEDHFRDPGKYFISIFGIPAATTIWGWRFEGHHIAYHFSANKGRLVAGTPSFMGSNPARVLEGPAAGKVILKDETELGFALLHALSPEALQKAVIDTTAPADIITSNNRKAMIDHPSGIKYNELTAVQQQMFLQLLNVYIHRYTKLFAEDMLQQIQKAGLENLWFSWAGYKEHVIGHPYYYRIQGPTIIIEYDNTQNNANHIHTVIRDLSNDFGGDVLLEHYRAQH
jgi:hypothetical protein